MSAILHVRERGHKCHSPFRTPPASHMRAGEELELNGWRLYYSARYKAYVVLHARSISERYEFTNLQCAAAKLAELGGYNV